MSVFVDTSALLAVLNAGDQFHGPAKNAWREILSSHSAVLISNYILLETIALLQNRFGIEAIRLLESDVLPVIEIIWVNETCHKRAISALLAANRRRLSLVDCTSFEIMREEGLDTGFTFDPHFHEQGFAVIPPIETEP